VAKSTAPNGYVTLLRNRKLHIESGLFRRQGKAVTNFKAALPDRQSDLAQQLIKDPYNFDFLTLAPAARERNLEQAF
jgi:predicted nuclease of restriction endonuclease-like (RecB) superfamily